MKSQRRHPTLALILTLCAIIAACGRRSLTYTYQHIHDCTFTRLDTLEFPIDSVPVTGQYDLQIGARISNDFSYRTLWLVVEQRWDDQPTHRDTLEFVIAEEGGHMKGSGVNRKEILQDAPALTLQSGWRGTLRIYHIMRNRAIHGVENIAHPRGRSIAFHVMWRSIVPLFIQQSITSKWAIHRLPRHAAFHRSPLHSANHHIQVGDPSPSTSCGVPSFHSSFSKPSHPRGRLIALHAIRRSIAPL